MALFCCLCALGPFEELQKRLTEAPILVLPRSHGGYTLDTDASANEVGALFLQEKPDQSTQPVGYCNRSLNAAKRHYSTTERKCLAVVWSALLLLQYIEGTNFTVRIDNAALRWMLHTDGSHGRLARWRLPLAEFDYIVHTRPDASHHAADTISRILTHALDESPSPEKVQYLSLPNSASAWQAGFVRIPFLFTNEKYSIGLIGSPNIDKLHSAASGYRYTSVFWIKYSEYSNIFCRSIRDRLWIYVQMHSLSISLRKVRDDGTPIPSGS